ncbi:MAG TPA: DEAD/DEAH box helicase, partial [Geminicoccaceae bacterium]|nr:DEAD/DEAH box helicase [Geminicoccaceae bacterium]
MILPAAASASASAARAAAPIEPVLPPTFAAWFASRGWRLRRHQAAMLELARQGRDALLVAPTGGGKTLGGFLPSLMELHEAGSSGRLHTLYVSPLKALTTDVARNLTVPVEEMGLPVRVETRTGDTPQNRRQRQRKHPPDMLLTTPESLALLLSYPDAGVYFAGLRRVVLDELHALAGSKRGALLSLALARLRAVAPAARFVGLSATVADPPALLRYLTPLPGEAALVEGEPGAEPEVRILLPEGAMPWAGHVAIYAARDILRQIEEARLTLVFVNTRAQAELIFGALWRQNRGNLPIALHHGSLDVEQRRRVEAAIARGNLRAVVAT